MKNKTWTWILIIIVVILLATAAGVIYWTSVKTRKVADSALNSAKNAESVLTPTPSASSTVAKSPAATLVMPTSDVEGEDLVDVPRFNGAIRSAYEKTDDGSVVNIEYYGQATSKEILDFYKTTLPTKDWLLRAESPSALNFSKTGAEVAMEIVDEDKLNKITQYKIHWFKTETQPEE